MGRTCAIKGCCWTSKAKLTLHRFPKDITLREAWCSAILDKNRQTINKVTENTCICERHFSPEDYTSVFPLKILYKNAVPTRFHGSEISCEEDSQFDPAPAAPDVPVREENESTLETKMLKKKVSWQRSIIKAQREQIRRLKKQVKNLTEKMNTSTSTSTILSMGKIGGRYPSNVRALALSSRFHGSRSYKFHKKLGKLPSERTIRAWHSKINVSTGVTEVALRALRMKIEEEKSAGKKEVYGVLVMDEMALRRTPSWCNSKKKIIGYEDFGDTGVAGQGRVAIESLVFLVSAINGKWKIPIAYFLTAGTSGKEKWQLTQEILTAISSTEIKIIAFTFDGCKSNVELLELLTSGSFGEDTYFRHPTQQHNVHIFLDGAHMMKLMRRYLATAVKMRDSEGNLIKWSYVEELHNLQQKLGLHFGNKLRKRHIEWENLKMNVKVAAQTLSRSVSSSIDFLRELDVDAFQGSEGTTKYILLNDQDFVDYSYFHSQPWTV